MDGAVTACKGAVVFSAAGGLEVTDSESAVAAPPSEDCTGCSLPPSAANDRIHSGSGAMAGCGAGAVTARALPPVALVCPVASFALRCGPLAAWAPREYAAGAGEPGLVKPARTNT